VDDFRRAAQAGDQVQLQVDGDAYRLIATGKTPSGRSVAWVDGGLDTTRMFVDALDRAYGPGLARAVANELDLRPTAAPLPSDKIEQALKMADTAAGALDGVRFAEMLASRATGEPPTKA
jgi:hypothetical protein